MVRPDTSRDRNRSPGIAISMSFILILLGFGFRLNRGGGTVTRATRSAYRSPSSARARIFQYAISSGFSAALAFIAACSLSLAACVVSSILEPMLISKIHSIGLGKHPAFLVFPVNSHMVIKVDIEIIDHRIRVIPFVSHYQVLHPVFRN